MTRYGRDGRRGYQGGTRAGGRLSRGIPYLRDGRSAYFVQQNRGKKSLCVDREKPEGHAIVAVLVGRVDVVVENYSPGVIDRLGSITTRSARSIHESSCARFQPSGRADRSRPSQATTSSRRPTPQSLHDWRSERAAVSSEARCG